MSSSGKGFVFWLLRKLVKPEFLEEIEGNLIEYRKDLEEQDKSLLKLRFFYESINYFRPALFKKLNILTLNPMFNFNLKVTLRNLLKYKSTTSISLLGFIVSLVSVIFLYFYLENELTYDDFHVDKVSIFKM